MNQILSESEELVVCSLQKALAKKGRHVALPEGTDITKTYYYRHIQRFIKTIDNLQIRHENIPFVIEALVEYANERKLLSRGYTILNNSKMLEIVLSKLRNENKTLNCKIQSIQRIQSFLISQGGNIEEVLLQKPHEKSMTNFTKWFEQGRITPEFIALSKMCIKTLQKLDKSERVVLPRPISLMALKHKILSDVEFMNRVIALMGDDLDKTV